MEDMRLTDEEISDAYCDTEIKSKNYKDFADYMFARVVAVADSQIAKVLHLLVEKAGETPQLVKTEPVDFGDLDSFFERGAEAQLEADNAHYRPIIGALKAEIERLKATRDLFFV